MLAEPSCEGCHSNVVAFRAGTTPAFSEFGIDADLMDGLVDCTDCHAPSEPYRAETIQTACLDCPDGDEYGDRVEQWRREVASLTASLARRHTADAESVLAEIRAAGPQHNMEATRTILHELTEDGP